jgi:hypothetical protein
VAHQAVIDCGTRLKTLWQVERGILARTSLVAVELVLCAPLLRSRESGVALDGF